MQHRFALGRLAQGIGQRIGIDVLEQAGEGAGLDRRDDLLDILERGQQHDLGIGACRANRARGLDAATRHDEVDEGDVGLLQAALFDRRSRIVGFADDGQIGMRLEEGADALADQVVVIGNDDADGFAHLGSSILKLTVTRAP